MIQEILLLTNEVLKTMDEVENMIFSHYRAKYAYAKTVLDNYREDIEEIRQELNGEIDIQSATELKQELNNMTESVLAARDNGMIKPVTNVQTLDSTIKTLITDLDNKDMETVLPTASIDVQAIENAIPNLESEDPKTVEIIEGTQDVIPESQPVIIEEAPVGEVIQTVAPNMVIVDDTQNSMSSVSEPMEIPAVEPMIDVSNITMPNSIPITEVTQETQA